MKKILILVFVLSILSCKRDKNVDFLEKNNVINDTISFSDTEVLGDINLEEVEKTEETDSALVKQANVYIKGFESADSDLVFNYIYPGVIEYLKNEYGEAYNDQMMKDIIVQPQKMLKEGMKQKGFDYRYEVADFKNIVDTPDYKISSFSLILKAWKGDNLVSSEDKVIAISNDNGINWKFMQKDPELSKKVLSLKFSDDIIEKIMK